MRILIASHDTIPGYSGGWTTPLDLLQDEHEIAYAVKRGRAGHYVLEGVPVYSVETGLRFAGNWPVLNRVRIALASHPFRNIIAKAFESHKADFVLCLNVYSAIECLALNLPYALRFHGAPSRTPPGVLRKLLDNALFVTLCQGVEIPGENFETLMHFIDLTRFDYVEHPKAEKVLMLSTLNPLRQPELFIEGVMQSKLSGTIIGDGILRRKVEKLCKETNGKVTYHSPVPRLDLPEFLNQFQIGVACFQKVPLIYQMRVNEYMASGLYPLVMPWTHLAAEAPDITQTFESPEELAERIDFLADNWEETLDSRRKAREFVLENYDVSTPKTRMREILEETFGESNNSHR